MSSSEAMGEAMRAETMWSRFGRSWGWLFAFGVLTLVAGLIAVAWPGRTVVVLAVVFGVQLLVGGIFWFVAAMSSRGQGTAGQIVLAVLAVISGVVCLRSPVQVALLLPLVLGLYWIINGLVEMFQAVTRGEEIPARGWVIAAGVLSVLAGIAVLVYPGAGLLVLGWVLGFWLIVYGAITTSRSLSLRASQNRPAMTAHGPTPA
jgi:uncharacterized membrane protein HdeD (DUF308 family)